MAHRPLAGQKALVTGDSGIGAGVARARRLRLCRGEPSGRPSRQRVPPDRAGGPAGAAIRADVAGGRCRHVPRDGRCLSTIDILVNNAGLQQDASFVDRRSTWNTIRREPHRDVPLLARMAREMIRRSVRPQVSRARARSSACPRCTTASVGRHVNYTGLQGG
jgi:glucose 1-dehydrogenase